jgi:hypothetical protein
MTWPPNDPPPGWQACRDRWDTVHTIRTASSVAGLGCLAAAGPEGKITRSTDAYPPSCTRSRQFTIVRRRQATALARHLQVEQGRAPAVLGDHDELARQAADRPRCRHQQHRRDHHPHRPGRAGAPGRRLLAHRSQGQHRADGRPAGQPPPLPRRLERPPWRARRQGRGTRRARRRLAMRAGSIWRILISSAPAPALDMNTWSLRRRTKILAKLRSNGRRPPTSEAAEK